MNVKQAQKQSQLSEQYYEANDQVMFTEPDALISPDGPLSSVIGNNNINNQTTTDVTLANYRQGKFVEMFDNLDFEDLEEVPHSNGDILWSTIRTIDEITHSFYISKAEVLQSVTLTEASETEKQARADEYEIDAGDTVVIINGEEYFVDLHIPLNFGVTEDKTMLLKTGLFVIGNTTLAAGIAEVVAAFGKDAFKDVLKHIESGPFTTLWNGLSWVMKTGYRFVSKFIGQIAKGATVEAAVLAAKAAAGESWAEAMKHLTPKVMTYTMVGVLTLFTAPPDFILYPSYQNVLIYNLTDYDVDFDLPYIDKGEEENITSSHLDRKKSEILGGVDIGSFYDGLRFQLYSHSLVTEIGYTLRFNLKDSDGNVVKTFSALFEIPHSGDNSLYASTEEPASYEDYYNEHKDEQKVTQYSVNDGEHEIIVTYDYLSGKHKNPVTNQEEYLYNSLVVIRDVVSG